eukprot:3111232-Amphidinium_carterae.2
MGVEGLRSLNQKFMETCLPTETTDVALADAITASKTLLDSALYKVLEPEFQNQLTTCTDWLQSLKSKTPPSGFTTSNEFLTLVWTKLPLFFSVEKPKGSATDSPVVRVKGVPALQLAWAGMKDKTVDKLQIAEIDAVYVFKPWMAGDVQKLITKKRQAVVAASLKSKPAKQAETSKVAKSKLSADDKALLAAKKVLLKKK